MPRRAKKDDDGIYRRAGSPFWWISFQNRNGRQTRRSSQIPIAEDTEGLKALALRARWLAEQDTPLPTGDRIQGHTFDDLILAYMTEVTPKKRAPERDHWSARRLQPVFTGKPLEKIGAAEVRAYIKQRLEEGAQAGTVNKEIGLMSAATNWAHRELEWDLANPWTSRRQTEPPGRTRWLTLDETTRLVQAARTGRARAHLPAFIILCLHAGLRRDEALDLTWDRVDLIRNRLHMGATDQKGGHASEVPINSQARAALIERASFRAKWCPESPWVFCRRDGQHIASIKHAFATACATAGISDCHPHDLRRTCGSWLIQAGVGIERVARILRHADVRVTAQVYAHLRNADLEEAIEVLSQRREGTELSHSDITLTG